ncbi:MAG: peptidase E [SAR86 cluster bacterium]|mgnify:FL=1|jgi:aminopeptidase N|nr:peptidase E [SAR86 cluster bacterium]|tara:strand:- start:139 stop:837 length:699 start_codon:yes stop_codon:yes gene_type:complete
MDKQIIAIGGGGFGRNPGDGVIEQYILDQTGKEKPNICFIPTATGDNEAYKVNYYSTFSKLDCNPIHLDFFKRTPDLEQLIPQQDAIFVGGGNTKSMLAVWKDWNLDKLLKEAYEKGVVMSGVSAGANCWFERAVVDSWEEDLRVIDCMGFIKGICCPHYDEEPQRRPAVKTFLEDGIIDSCYSVEGNCALHIKNDDEYLSVDFGKEKNAYIVSIDDGKVKEAAFNRLSIRT